MRGTVEAGDAFLLNPSKTAVVDHLWVVLAVYTPDYSLAVCATIVNVTTVDRFVDRSCILRPGDPDAHPFITHESYVFYRGLREVEAGDTDTLQPGRKQTCIADALLSRMRIGLHRSQFTPRGFKAKVPQR